MYRYMRLYLGFFVSALCSLLSALLFHGVVEPVQSYSVLEAGVVYVVNTDGFPALVDFCHP